MDDGTTLKGDALAKLRISIEKADAAKAAIDADDDDWKAQALEARAWMGQATDALQTFAEHLLTMESAPPQPKSAVGRWRQRRRWWKSVRRLQD